MRLLVLSARPATASNRRLGEAADEAGVELDVVDASRAAAGSSAEVWCEGRDLMSRPPGVVLARVGNWRPDSMLALLEAIAGQGIPTPNPAPAIRIGRDHWRTERTLAAAGLPVPATYAGADPEALARAVHDRLRFPVVVKQRRSRMGVGVIRCDTLDHLEAVLDSLWRLGDELVVQQHVETGGTSLRLLVVGTSVVAAARFRATAGEWRSNAARGGVVEKLPIEAGLADLALEATKTVGLGVCGVDVLPGRDGPVIGELNPTPGFIGLETATGIDVAGKIVRYLIEIASRS